VAGAGPRVVPGAGRHAAAAGDLARDRRAPRLHRGAASGRGADVDDPPLVSDNFKTGVDKPDLYDPEVNRSYAELAAHCGCLVDPARALKPRDKARVERPMPYVRDSFWRGREFASLEQMQAEAARWSLEVAGQRARRPLEGAAPAAVFDAAERDALREADRLQRLPAGEDRLPHADPAMVPQAGRGHRPVV
jgi:hypothetical protein